MLTPEQIEGFRLAAGRLIDPINTYLLKDIARRIQDAGKLTSTAAYEAWRAEWLGKDRKELERDLAQLADHDGVDQVGGRGEQVLRRDGQTERQHAAVKIAVKQEFTESSHILLIPQRM